MRNFSIVAIVAASVGFASGGQALANSNGMGDPSASMRAQREVCDAQRRGEYPRYYNACLPGYPDKSVRH
jgi:hypothetical protein